MKVYHKCEVISTKYLRKGEKIMYKKYSMLLEKYHKTTYQVSKDTGIAQSIFSYWKSGRSNPKTDKLKILADYFKVTIEYFLEE